MSTLFFGLLSRTLQALLSKYLYDVDVDGVNLGGVFTDSGFGVRLSNVKLRDGTKLMDLPGTPRMPRRKIKRRRKDQTQKTTASCSEQEEASKGESRTVGTVDSEPETAAVDPPGAYKKKTSWFSSWYSSSSVDEAILEAATEDDSPPEIKDNGLEPPPLNVDTDTKEKTADGFFENAQDLSSPVSDLDPILGPHPIPDASADDDQLQLDTEIEAEVSPMCLRLGNGGSVGTLDVRLVNRTMHVLVEDADITVECVRLQASPEREEDTKPKKPEKPNAKEPVTTGDRVLAKNAIARIISGLPNLLLRDIRLRIVIRDEAVLEEEVPEYCPDDTVIEVSIELLSVTDGSDFLLNFGDKNEDEEEDEDEYSTDTQNFGDGLEQNASMVSVPEGIQNEFLTKRIRTGRGPEGGVVLRIYDMADVIRNAKTPSVLWARDTWCTYTEFVVLRLSGLDLQAKTFLGTRKEAAISRDGWYTENANDEFSVDEIVFGCDYIAPGPQPPLPTTMVGSDVAEGNNTILEDTPWTNPAATTFVTDANGIQSCALPSPFHRVARGFYPYHCTRQHLPCEACDECWTKDFGSAATHELDSSTPLSGFVCHASLRDPFEISVDRNSLETFGMLLSLFSRRKADQTPENKCLEDESVHSVGARSPGSVLSRTFSGTFDDNSRDGASKGDSLDVSRRSIRGPLDRSRRSTRANDLGASGIVSAVTTTEALGQFDTENGFPSYMQPENIQSLGFYLSKFRFRVHVLQENGKDEDSSTFCYLDIGANCVTFDYQELKVPERPFQDLRLDIGYLKISEHKGIQEKEILALGICNRKLDVDEMTVDTYMANGLNHSRPPWPTTAASLLDIAPPLESMPYEERLRHAIQLRYSAVADSISETKNRSRKDVIVQLGTPSVNTAFAIKDNVMKIIREMKLSVLGPAPERPADVDDEIKKSVDSSLRYKVVTDAGRIQLFPLISAEFPATTLEGELSSEAGFSIRGFLERIEFEFGQQSKERFLDKGLSIHQIALLPETVRLRVLLFIKDLRPLETALGLPPSSNAFLRCRAINKEIAAVAKEVSSREKALHGSKSAPQERRRNLVSELLALDDDILENLLETHRRNQKNDSNSVSL